jgi:TolB-like protein/DNA-binding SARP family transcriptional activator
VVFTLRLFGGLAVEGPDGPLTGRAAQKRRLALLSLLAVAPARAVSRDKLIACLWPETETEQGRHLLSVSIYELRKALGEAAIVSRGDDLVLGTELVCADIHEFGEALEGGDWERAVALYTGPFLDGVFVSDAPEFERWAESERQRYVLRYTDALEKSAEERAARGDTRGAVEAWRRLAAHDPFNSRVALGLMRALEAAGDRAGAIQHARVYTVLLHEEFGAEPDPDVEALAERLRQEPAPAESSAREQPVEPPAPATATVDIAGAAADQPTTEAVPDTRARPPEVDTPSPAPRPATLGSRARRSLASRPGRLIAAALLVVLVGVAWAGRSGVPYWANTPALPTTIAVLPFVDVSPDGSNEFFSDGLTEEIINALSKIEGLRVPARTSAFAFKGKNIDVREVGDRLGVSSVLEGSVRTSGDRLRITVRLIDVTNGYDLWSRTYERRMGEIFEVQDEIARSVVSALKVELAGGAQTELVQSSTEDIEAYNLYLKGRYHWYKRTGEGFRQAIAHFQQATERDPGYALAYTGLADVYNMLGAFDYGVLPPNEAFPKAKAAAERALALDPDLAEAHTARANTLLNYEWNWPEAEREFRRATELNPGYAPAHHWYSLYLMAVGREEDALVAMKRARELDPLSLVMSTGLARHYYFARDFDRAIAEYTRALEVDPDFVTAHLGLGLTYEAKGAQAEAITEYRKALDILGDPLPVVIALLGHAHGRAGNRPEALKMLQQLRNMERQRYVAPENYAIINLGIGEEEQALDWLERAYENRSGSMIYLGLEPPLDPIRSHPRFARLLSRVGLRTSPAR